MYKSAKLCCFIGFAAPPNSGLNGLVTQLNTGACLRKDAKCAANYKDMGTMYKNARLCCFTAFSSAPMPSPAGTCLSGMWPEFKTAVDLQTNAPWFKYFNAVYGQLPTSGYPLCLGSTLWTFYDKLIISLVAQGAPPIVGDCPTKPNLLGQRYRHNHIYTDPNRQMSWSWHPYPYSPVSSNQWVEVEHQADPFGDEKYGAWFMQAAGSGMWFNTGLTMSFAEHQDAYAHFNIKQGNFNEEFCKAAAATNIDSVQFTAHVDPVQYKECDTQHTKVSGLKYMNLEIVGVKLVGTYPCGSVVGAPATVRAGWRGSKPCKCDNSQAFLNCAGVGLLSGGPDVFV